MNDSLIAINATLTAANATMEIVLRQINVSAMRVTLNQQQICVLHIVVHLVKMDTAQLHQNAHAIQDIK